MHTVNRILLAGFLALQAICLTRAQGVPQVGERTDFAGVTIYISDANRRLMQQEVERLYINRTLVASKVEQMGMYFPLIEPVLAQESIPDDIKFLILEDSTMTSNIRSIGLWSISKSNPLGLRVNGAVDERLHLLTSTEAALAHLKTLYRKTGNWLVALHLYGSVYNGSSVPGGAVKAAARENYVLNGTDDELLMRLLAHKLVLERAFPAYRPQRPLILYPYSANTKQKTLSQLADFFRVDERDVIRMNLWLKGARVPYDKEYTVFIPTPLESFTEVKRRAGYTEGNPTSWQDMGFPVLRKLNEAKSLNMPVFYTINGKRGILAQLYDNEITLSHYGKIKIQDFLRYNDLDANQPVYAGEIYYLERKDKRAKIPYHVVKKGQTLWDVSQQYGIQMSYLIKYNDIKPDQRVTPDRILWLQKKRPKNTPVEYYRQPEMKRSSPVRSDTAVVVVKIALPGDESNAQRYADSLASLISPTEGVSPTLQSSQRPVPSASNATKMVKTTLVELTGAPAVSKPAAPREEKTIVRPQSRPLVIHTVEAGESYVSIARRYRVTHEQLLSWNGYPTERYPKPGQQLLIELPGDPSKSVMTDYAPVKTVMTNPHANTNAPVTVIHRPVVPETKSAPANDDEEPFVHVVKPGENLYRIGLRYKVTPAQIIKWNSIVNNTVSVGQRLLIWK